MGDARILDVSIDAYHADEIGCDVPALSSSIATTLVTRSPLHAWHEHPKLGGASRKRTRAMDLGTVVHTLVLGEGKRFAILDHDDYRTKAAREDRDAADASGHAPILRREYDVASAAADAIRARLRSDHGIALAGASEVAVTWLEPSSRGPVRCRAMFDHVDGARIVDLKTSHSAEPEAFERAMVSHGYDIQHAAYLRALESLQPAYVGRTEMVFVVAEIEPPFAMMVGSPAGDMAELGERRWHRAVETWARCLATNEWPGYPTRRHDLHAPAWAIQREEFAT